ncbi:MAG: class I SAM-dependent methyltransferase [bacterium]
MAAKSEATTPTTDAGKGPSRKGGKRADGNGRRRGSIAEKADLLELYENSVMAPEEDCAFFDELYRKLRKKKPLVLREDFCGTAKIATAWCAGGKKRRAIGVDLDEPTLEWGRKRNVEAAGLEDRVDLVVGDVLDPVAHKADVTCANNFSYCIFKKREELKAYLESALAGLNEKGMLFLEIYGGSDAMKECKEERDLDDMLYIWDQHAFDPLTHETLCYIHYHFPDGSKIKRAFTYDWRLWTIPELRDLLLEVGFKDVRLYWEGLEDEADDDGIFYGNGEYEDVTGVELEQQETFLVYVVGLK